jgi:cell division septum initiation protein DivIVA
MSTELDMVILKIEEVAAQNKILQASIDEVRSAICGTMKETGIREEIHVLQNDMAEAYNEIEGIKKDIAKKENEKKSTRNTIIALVVTQIGTIGAGLLSYFHKH